MLRRLEAPVLGAVIDAGTWLLEWFDHSPGAVLAVFLSLNVAFLLRWNRARALRLALGQLQQASQRHVNALEGELWRLRRQNELLNRRVLWYEQPPPLVS